MGVMDEPGESFDGCNDDIVPSFRGPKTTVRRRGLSPGVSHRNPARISAQGTDARARASVVAMDFGLTASRTDGDEKLLSVG